MNPPLNRVIAHLRRMLLLIYFLYKHKYYIHALLDHRRHKVPARVFSSNHPALRGLYACFGFIHQNCSLNEAFLHWFKGALCVFWIINPLVLGSLGAAVPPAFQGGSLMIFSKARLFGPCEGRRCACRTWARASQTWHASFPVDRIRPLGQQGGWGSLWEDPSGVGSSFFLFFFRVVIQC